MRPLDAAPGDEAECRIKGKVLKGSTEYTNPIAPGDIVMVELDPLHPKTGLILEVVERRNQFTRIKERTAKPQVLAANVDQIFCVCTPASPPWRPRFLDRLLIQAEIAEIPAVILCNKWDLAPNKREMEEQLDLYRSLEYPVLLVSALDGYGMDRLRECCAGKLSVLTGQSGVGKSSLINALLPGSALSVGRINEKYNRGTHTTTVATLFEDLGIRDAGIRDAGIRIIDTPGLRRFIPEGISGEELIYYMREFAPLAGTCSYGLSCSHRSERGCAVRDAVEAGRIHADRYESFLRIYDALQGKSDE